jgi:hypothetical protein
VLYEAADRRVLVDPLEHPCSVPSHWPDDPQPPDLRDLGPLDAVLVTHGDNDHLNPRTLLRVAREVPVYIPAAPAPMPYQVDAAALLALLGFATVVALSPWDRVALGPAVTLASAPFRGEDWGLVLAAQSLVLAAPGLTVYLNADSTSDPAAEARVAAEFPRIDLAFLGVTGAAEAHAMPPPFGYGHLYAPWIPAEKRNEWVRLCNGPRESAAVARRLGARHAFGYAAGGARFYELAYTDRGSHAALAAALRGDREAVTAPLDLPLGRAVRVPP